MSRTKKSRKPATAPKAKPKLSKKELTQIEKRTKKSTGKKPGNRQLEAQPKSKNKVAITNKDPRIGSKKPIVLVKESQAKEVSPKISVEKDIVPIQFTEIDNLLDEILVDEETLITELTAIEQDEKLQAISVKDDIEITEEEVEYFNSMMARHQELCQLLGIEYGEQEEEQQSTSRTNELDEDTLWDKLDNTSDFMDDFSNDEKK